MILTVVINVSIFIKETIKEIKMDNNLLEIWNYYQLGDENVFHDIIRRYNEPHRVYHNLDHIRHLFKEFNSIHDKLHNPRTVAGTIISHDIIQDDELESSRYVDNLDDTLDKETIRQYVLSSMSHHPIMNDNDELYFLDMDLCILGSSYNDFVKYDKKVRKEYSWVNWNLFREKRIEFFRNMLRTNRIFRTEYYFNRCEFQARYNIGYFITQYLFNLVYTPIKITSI